MSRHSTIRALVIACTGLLLPAAASAQGTSTKSAPPRGAAERLEAVAASPKVQPGDWVEAAQALEHAARLRGARDPVIVNDLLGAATAWETAGKPVTARRLALEGARQAVRMGDVYTAANAYLAAARLSLQLHDEGSAFTCLDHAKQLAASPRLTPEQARTIMAQVGRI